MRSARGVPFRLTLQQLRRESFAVEASVVSIVENPSIVRAAADAMGPDCPPLVCTEGVPSAAVGAKGIVFRGGRVEPPWDHRLGEFMAAEGRAVMEESLIGLLLQDLRECALR